MSSHNSTIVLRLFILTLRRQDQPLGRSMDVCTEEMRLFMWSQGIDTIVSRFEQYLAIMCGSIPYLPQLVKRWQGKDRSPRPSLQPWLEEESDSDGLKNSLDRLFTRDSWCSKSKRERAGPAQRASTEGGAISTAPPIWRHLDRSSSTVNYNRFVV